MANECKNAIKGNKKQDIMALAIAADAAIAANIEAAATVTVADAGNRYTGTNVESCLQEIAGSGRTTETVKANADGVTAVKGTGWTNQTVKGNADKIALTDLYPITVVGGNTISTAVFTAIGNKPTNRTPAVGDEIVMIVGVVTATGVPVASPAIVAADTSDGVVKLLALDTTVKVKWGRSSGADLSANTYTCWVKPA